MSPPQRSLAKRCRMRASSRIQALRFSAGATFPLGGASLAAIAAQWRGPRGRLRSVEAERREVAKLRELAAALGPASPAVREGYMHGRGRGEARRRWWRRRGVDSVGVMGTSDCAVRSELDWMEFLGPGH